MIQAVNPWGMTTPPSLVIFDLDGTLVDSLEDLAISVNVMRSAFGLDPVTPEQVRRGIGKGARNLVIRTMPDNYDRIDEALKIFLDHNGANLAAHTRLFPGARELLAGLRDAGVPVALVSNKNTAHCGQLLALLGVVDCFSVVLGGDAVASCKPSPEPLLAAVARIGGQAGTTVMIGDSCNDFEAAAAAGVRSIGCEFGYGEPWELDQANVRVTALYQLLPLPWTWNG